MEGEAAAGEDDVVDVAAAVGVGMFRGWLEEDFGIFNACIVDYPAEIFP